MLHPHFAGTRARAAATALVILLAAVSGSAGLAARAEPASAALPSPSQIEQQFFDLINGARRDQGLPLLVSDPLLSSTCIVWSQKLADQGFLAHDPNLAAVAASVDPKWVRVGENVGMGTEIYGLFQAFMNSPGHRANILGDFNRLGLGVVVSNGVMFITQRFLKATPLVAPPPPIVPNAGFHPLSPSRILDTRIAVGTAGGVAAPIGPGGTIEVQVAGKGGVPSSGVSGVLLNVTATSPTATSFLSVYPRGASRPLTSNLNFVPGQTVADMVDARLGSEGKVSVFNAAGSVNVIADVAGYFDDGTGTGAHFTAVSPARLLDTREGVGAPRAKVAAGGVVSLTVTGAARLPVSGIGAVALSVTAVNGTASSHVTVWPGSIPMPVASNLNFSARETVPNLAVVQVGTDGKVNLYNNAGTVDLVADVMGYFDSSTTTASAHTALTPARLLDTRFGPGAIGMVGAGGVISVAVRGQGGVSGTATAVVVTITVTDPSAATHVTAYPSGETAPNASNVNAVTGQTKPVLAIVKVGADGRINLRNNSGAANLILDVAGYFDLTT